MTCLTPPDHLEAELGLIPSPQALEVRPFLHYPISSQVLPVQSGHCSSQYVSTR